MLAPLLKALMNVVALLALLIVSAPPHFGTDADPSNMSCVSFSGQYGLMLLRNVAI